MTEIAEHTSVKILDLKGLLCPMPIVRMAKAIQGIEVGQTIEAVATDPGVMADIPAWARSTGHELVLLERRDREFRFIVRRKR